MATNQYFSQGRRSEQNLYEDLIIESLKMYGQDVYYIPREIVNKDTVFNDDTLSRFKSAYKIEVYIENNEGFDGEGDLFTKFGIEIRDAATFVMARRRWNHLIARYEETVDKPFYRPREGDLLYLTLSGSIFEITKVQDESPFYQLKNLPVFRMDCELFEYTDEDFDTGVDVIDDVEDAFAYQYVLTFDTVGGVFQKGEIVTQTNNDYEMNGEVVRYYADSDLGPDTLKLYLAHVGATDGNFHTFTTTSPVVGGVTGAQGTPTLVEQLQNIQQEAQNESFNASNFDFLDFNETNPFGDPN